MLGEVIQIRGEMSKLKMLFFKAMLDPKADPREVRTLKERILSLDQKKTNKMLNAFEEVNSILGRKSAEDERVYRALFMPRSDFDLN
jgi:hypothetical protein